MNSLYIINNCLHKRNGDNLVPISDAVPPRIGLSNFIKWVLNISNDIEGNPPQVICLGYNNSAFDDHFLAIHCKKKLDDDIFSLMRKKLFTSDLKNICNFKGKLETIFGSNGGTQEDIDNLHDALADCKAVAKVAMNLRISFHTILMNIRSFESVYQKTTNPLLKASLITDTVAAIMGIQMTCEEYLKMSDQSLQAMLESFQVPPFSIATCLKKRRDYISGSNSQNEP